MVMERSGTCSTTGTGFDQPNIIAINPMDTFFAYIGNSANNTFTYCAINSDGSFGACNHLLEEWDSIVQKG